MNAERGTGSAELSGFGPLPEASGRLALAVPGAPLQVMDARLWLPDGRPWPEEWRR